MWWLKDYMIGILTNKDNIIWQGTLLHHYVFTKNIPFGKNVTRARYSSNLTNLLYKNHWHAKKKSFQVFFFCMCVLFCFVFFRTLLRIIENTFSLSSHRSVWPWACDLKLPQCNSALKLWKSWSLKGLRKFLNIKASAGPQSRKQFAHGRNPVQFLLSKCPTWISVHQQKFPTKWQRTTGLWLWVWRLVL